MELKTAIDNVKQAKSLLSDANNIMSANVSRLKNLESENAELKQENAALEAEIDDWKGNAEGFEPDAYMRLPVDADGVSIRIGDTVWFEDKKSIVTDITLSCEGWDICTDSDGYGFGGAAPETLSHKKPEPADSWEKLEEDAMKHSCEYFGIGLGNASCGDCPHGSRRTGRACWANAGLDMIARAKKLAGIEEQEGK